MAINTSLRVPLYTSVAEAVYKEITTFSGRYFYFLGKTLEWYDELTPPRPNDSIDYEIDTRKNIIITKQINPGDVAFVIDRVDWTSGTVYDMYDDRYGDDIIGVNLTAGGSGYSGNTTVTFSGGGYTIPAVANATIVDGVITGINMIYTGAGYNTLPTVSITDPDASGNGAAGVAVSSAAYSGARTLEDANFYVITDDFNIYKCLDNNNNSSSTVKPADVRVSPFTLSDGYKWKFMGFVPPGLRNRFLSNDYVPVITALNRNFYSQGEIKDVTVFNTGTGYTSASILVDGDGYLESNPVYILSAVVAAQGNGYTTANVTIAPPVSYSGSWANNTIVYNGTRLEHENNVYEVIIPGTTGLSGPIHTVGIGQNGTCSLKYLGTVATGNATISSGNISAVTLDGVVGEITVTDSGSGYTAIPQITISGGGGSNARAYGTVTNGFLTSIVMADIGKGYTSAPTVTVGKQWAANAAANVSEQLFFSDRLYTVTLGSGNAYTQLGSTGPIHTTGNALSGNATLTYAGNAATATAVLRYGFGYSAAPNVTIGGDGANAEVNLTVEKSEAILVPILKDGLITGVQIKNGGVDYTSATLTVVGDGANAKLTASFSEGDLLSLQATNELLTVPGTIDAIKVVSSGFGYSSANVTITGDGTGATATATIVSGEITKIDVVNPGKNYTSATVTITGDGDGAQGRPILPPARGHGKDPVSELNCRSLSLFTSITGEKNQGFTVSNDYRQFGIIKDISDWDDTKFYSQAVGSACWVLSASSVNTTNVTNDTILISGRSARYLVVGSTSTSVLVVSVDGVDPVVGDTMLLDETLEFTVSGVTEPDVDKYSGKLLYIDNRQAFTTTDQAVSIRTVFKY